MLYTAAALERATLHRDRYAASIPGMLGGMPAERLPAGQVRAHLATLRDALENVGRRGMNMPGSDPASRYGAALAVMSDTLGAFLSLEPEPYTCAVLFITYAAVLRDMHAADSAHAAAFLEGADAGTLTPELAQLALSSFPDLPTLAAFLGAHHAFSLAVEALADPDTDPAGKLGDALETVRREVLTAPVSGNLTA